MENKIYQNVPLDIREKMLQDMATRTEERPVKKHFTPEDLTEFRKQYFDNALTQRKAVEILNKAKEIYNESVKLPIKENIYLSNNIRTGFVEVTEQVYLFDDTDGFMYIYDNQGALLESRRLLPEERQREIKQNNPVLD